MCQSVCKNNAIDIGESTSEEFILQMIDNAVGVVDFFGKEKIFYINYFNFFNLFCSKFLWNFLFHIIKTISI